MNDLNDNQCPRAHEIWVNDEYATEVGWRLIRELDLTPSEDYEVAFELACGVKTPAGVARTVLSAIGIY